ncbi:MAG: hypothetical protein JSV43_05185 [Methanobacteriota archaeon]|nr:MAG: hypothetical protein JSV43_05185 [Euryarchaeota archaeon]
MFRRQEEGRNNLVVLKAGISVIIVALFLIAVPGGVVDQSVVEEGDVSSLSPYEAYVQWTSEQARVRSELLEIGQYTETSMPGYLNAAFPEIAPDGRPIGFHSSDLPESPLLWENFTKPPYNTGGGYSLEATSSLGEYQVGHTHEYYIGDQNGNGIEEYVVYYFHRPSSINGIDDDGDGCVDEPTYGNSTNQTGCDLVPDAMTYFETGGLPYLGGSNGDLVVFIDWASEFLLMKIFKIGVSTPWMAYKYRGPLYYPQIVGDFVSYYSTEYLSNVNANPEMDNDRLDYLVGSIDVRGFPDRAPVNYVCSAGRQHYGGATYLRDDGWIVGSYSLLEHHDNHDWNGDGDTLDEVAAYYAVDPVTGSCRQGVNGGVAGYIPINRGTIMTPMHTGELYDNRDWNNDGDLSSYVMLYHDINSTWQWKGKIYSSITYTAPVPRWGFGWWAVYHDGYPPGYRFPLEFGGTFNKYAYPYGYKTYFWLIDDEDGDRHTSLPAYEIGIGYLGGTVGGRCIIINAREQDLGEDINRDGDFFDIVAGIFCPHKTGGGGNWIVENPAAGHPWIYVGYYTYLRYTDYVLEDSEGRVAIPFICNEYYVNVDLDGDEQISTVWIHISYLFKIPN